MLARVRILFDSVPLTDRVARLLSQLDVAWETAEQGGRFWDRLGQNSFDLLFTQVPAIPAPVSDNIQFVRDLPSEPDLILFCKLEDPQQRAEFLSHGCLAVLNETTGDDTLLETISALINRRIVAENQKVQSEIDEAESPLLDFASDSPVMRTFVKMVRRVIDADSSLLLLGETGVGKERLARSIHEASPRSRGPFLPVNCAAFPESLLDSELFGHDRGAFTGATSDRRGYFEMAHGGTIFLDEIAELPIHLQVKLLRVLQERAIQRLGSEESIAINVRVMAATNRNLNEEMRERRFRRDLYYRLGVVSLEVPPLRSHPEDIPRLLNRYLEQFRIAMRRPVDRISPPALDMLCRYEWPGNVRELINVIERAVLLSENEEISVLDLPPEMVGAGRKNVQVSNVLNELNPLSSGWEDQAWSQVRAEILAASERTYLVANLRGCGGRVGETARKTGLNPRTLHLMMKRHGLRKEDYRR